MTMYRSTLRMFSFAIPLLAAGAPALMAQNRTLFTWTGRVDREVQITMRGRDVWTNGADRDDTHGRINVESTLPRSDGYVRVQTLDGRGDVSVVQQPSSSNGYTTIVRVRDRSSGSDRYRLAAYWDSRYSDNRGGYGDNRGGYGHGNGGYGRGSENVPSRIDPRDRSNGGWNNGNGGWNSGTALRWSGNVDGEIEIRLQGRQIDERVLSGGVIRDERSSIPSEMPRRDAQLVISQRSGRGTVYVAQQPSAYNGYTAVIRVRDPQGGYGYYDFQADYR
ncbi:MAG TPA: hypothetical protein VFD67_10350 [Gemmatimonadaceae bacterium]|nr:hypothetical protein [Gemmatimonadaceae bacterium]